MDRELRTPNFKLFGKGENFITAIGASQMVYILCLCILIMQMVFQRPLFAYLVLALPKLATMVFLLDYCASAVILLRQFENINTELEEMREKSFRTNSYPQDERSFQNHLMEITGKHRKLATAGKQVNTVFALQLLVTIGALYTYILANSYIGLYAVLVSFKNPLPPETTIVSAVNLLFNVVAFLLLVEITNILYQEVSESICVTS